MTAIRRCKRSLPHRKILNSRVGYAQAVYTSRKPSAESANLPLRIKKMIKREACDKWFSDVVREKANYTCEHCKKTDSRMECAHIYGRRLKSVRWSLDNAVCLCHWCHRDFTENPLKFTDWLNQYFGEGHMEILREKQRGIFKATPEIKKEISKHYRDELKLMGEDSDYRPRSYN